jgi:hypothetical protein
MNKHTDDGNNGDFCATENVLRQVIEVGRVWIADFTNEYRLYLDTTVEHVQEQAVRPFAILPANKQAWAIVNLLAALISETFPTGEIDLPEWFHEDLKFAKEIFDEADPGKDGNVGTKSDNISVKIVGRDGRELS